VSRGEVLMFGESHTHVDNATSFPQRVISLEFLMAICGKNFAMSNELVGSCATVLSGEVLTGTKREGVGCVLSCRYCIAKTKPHGEIPYLDFPVSAAAEESRIGSDCFLYNSKLFASHGGVRQGGTPGPQLFPNKT
jgi:hypothetical protein